MFAIFNVCYAGRGAVYSFDPVGSYQRNTYKAGGSASAMLQPLLDNQVNDTHWLYDLFMSSVMQTYHGSNQVTVQTKYPCLFVLAQIGFKNMEGVQHVPLTQEKAVQLVKDVFISAAERDVYTGDALQICIITKEGIKDETIPLRKD